jgi:hypothetical protein
LIRFHAFYSATDERIPAKSASSPFSLMRPAMLGRWVTAGVVA